MLKKICWGIFRERAHSPDRVGDDEIILRLTAEKINRLAGFEVSLFQPDDILQNPPSGMPDLVFCMCEKREVLEILDDWSRDGVIAINTPRSIFNTYRKRTIRLLGNYDYFPRTELISIGRKDFSNFQPLWVKRRNFHATSREDVQFAENFSAFKTILGNLLEKGIEEVIVQEHIEGDLLKFYGVKNRWFHCFYHKNQELKGYPYDKSRLEFMAAESAAKLGLDIYGGDAIATREGRIFLIDLNAWPSFALYRETASNHIATHVLDRVSDTAPLVL